MLKANIETFLACDASYEEAGIVLYGAPFDSTTSYRPGTRFGSRAIRSESYGLESYSPYQDRDLTDYAVFDAGDQELCFGDASLALKDLRERAAEVAGDGKIPFMLGGEHLVTLAPVQALAEKYPDMELCVRTGIYLITKECNNASEAIDAANYARKYAAGNCETGVKLYDEELKKQSDAE